MAVFNIISKILEKRLEIPYFSHRRCSTYTIIANINHIKLLYSSKYNTECCKCSERLVCHNMDGNNLEYPMKYAV